MTQQQILQIFLPILILLPVLYLRMRRMAGTRPLKLNRLWIQPAIILVLTVLALLTPAPGHYVVRHFMTQDWAWLAFAAGVAGAVAGLPGGVEVLSATIRMGMPRPTAL